MPNRTTRRPWNAAIITFKGFTYLVGRPAIEDDYAEFMVHADGLSLGHATEKARSNDLKFWVHEQIDHSDWQRLGTLIARPSYLQLIGKEEAPRDRDVRFISI